MIETISFEKQRNIYKKIMCYENINRQYQIRSCREKFQIIIKITEPKVKDKR